MRLHLKPPSVRMESSDGPFAQVARRPNLASDVIEQIEAAIVRGDLAPGDKLPPERELTDHFGVSRTVIREALHALVAKNLVDAQPGSGAVVAPPNTDSIANSLRLLLNLGRPTVELPELVEVRINLEGEIACLGAQRRQDSDLEALAETLAKMRSASDASNFTYQDMRFHLVLAEATQNRLYVILLHTLLDLVTDLSLVSSQTLERRKLATAFHERIYQHIKAQDGEKARSAMLEHLEAFSETARREAGA